MSSLHLSQQDSRERQQLSLADTERATSGANLLISESDGETDLRANGWCRALPSGQTMTSPS
jgi:hypothetical protein